MHSTTGTARRQAVRYSRDRTCAFAQVLNTIELVARGEWREPPGVAISLAPPRLRFRGARELWPWGRDLRVRTVRGKSIIQLPSLERYALIGLSLRP